MSKSRLMISLGLLSCVVSQSAYSLEQYFTNPGTRAMGMGGAFVAQASDSSAIWYNPAGLGFNASHDSGAGFDFTIESGDVLTRKDSADVTFDANGIGDFYATSSEIKYLAIAAGQVGFAYFKPYDFYSGADDGAGNIVRVHTEYSEIKYAAGFEVSEGLSLGFDLDMVLQSTDSNCANCSESDAELGFGGSMGVLFKKRVGEYGTEIRLGALARSSVSVDPIVGTLSDLPVRPSSTTMGFAIGQPIKEVYLTFSYALEDQDYDPVIYPYYSFNVPVSQTVDLDNEKTNMGFELSFYPTDEITMFVRMGSTESDAVVPSTVVLKAFDIGYDSSSIGFGIQYAGFTFDFATESREVIASGDLNDTKNETEDMTSMSLSYSF